MQRNPLNIYKPMKPEFIIHQDGKITKGDNPAYCVFNQAMPDQSVLQATNQLTAKRAFSCNAYCVGVEIGNKITEDAEDANGEKQEIKLVELIFYCCKRKAVAEYREGKTVPLKK